MADISGLARDHDANGLPPRLWSFAPGGRIHRSAINDKASTRTVQLNTTMLDRTRQALFGVGSGSAFAIGI
jgi:hypothetical protein